MNIAWEREAAKSGKAFADAMRILPSTEIAKKPVYDAVKRAIDFCIGLFGGILLLLPIAIIAVFVRLDSNGPIIYRQERLGIDGRPFTLLKFRSMRTDAEAAGPQWAEKYDPRVTKVGRILRKTRLDELPQIWNILKGDMSLVGPRPERQFFYEAFEERLPGFSRRLAVKPGLTGWAQVNGGYDLRPPEKIIYDMEYIKNRSLAMDFKCVLKTVHIVFDGEGAR